MTLSLVPFRGHTVPLLAARDEISRYSTQDYINWITSSRYMGAPMPVTTYGNRPAEPITNSFQGFVEGMLYPDGPVAAAEAYRLRVFGQAPILYQEIVDGRPGDLFDDEALDRLRAPWPGANLGDLMKRILVYGDFGGNGFILDLEDELVLVRPDWVEFVLAKRTYRGGQVGWKQVGIVYYEGGLRTNDGVPFLPGEYSHFVPGLPDPLANYRGMSWLTPLVREVQADKSAGEHKVAYFENAASPNLAVSLPKEITPTQFEAFVQAMDDKHKGARNAYSTLYTAGGADVTVIGANMQQMDFSSVIGKGETRIANAAGVPPTLLSFSEGMQGSSLNAGNYTAAKRNFVDTTMRDLWANFAGSLQQMEAFRPPREKTRVWYDGRDIPFLHEDAKDLAEIQQTRASTINSYITAGYKPETAVTAVAQDDVTKLEHTGLTSVQLMPPGSQDTNGDGVPDAEAQAGEDYEAALDEFRSELEPHWDDIWRAERAANLAAHADLVAGVSPDFDDEDEIERRDYYDVRDYRGRFRKISDRIGHALNEWLKGDGGSDDPLDDFSREQLRLGAKEFGITPRRGASSGELKLALLKDARTRFRAEKGQDQPSHRLTLQSPPHRDQDVGVYQEKSGKVSLYRESSTGQRGTRIVSVDSLEALQQWGVENDEPQVSSWAASERGVPVKKVAPRKAAPKKAAAPVATPEQIREVEVENAIRKAYRDLARNPNSHVMLADLREKTPDVDRAEFDAAMTRLAREGGQLATVHLAPQEDQKRLSPRLRDASVRFGDENMHMVAFEDPSPRSLPAAPTPAKKAAKKAVPASPYELAPGLKGALGKRRQREREEALMDVAAGSLSVIQSPDMIEHLESLQANGYAHRDGKFWRLTDKGRAYVNARKASDSTPSPALRAKSAPAKSPAPSSDLDTQLSTLASEAQGIMGHGGDKLHRGMLEDLLGARSKKKLLSIAEHVGLTGVDGWTAVRLRKEIGDRLDNGEPTPGGRFDVSRLNDVLTEMTEPAVDLDPEFGGGARAGWDDVHAAAPGRSSTASETAREALHDYKSDDHFADVNADSTGAIADGVRSAMRPLDHDVVVWRGDPGLHRKLPRGALGRGKAEGAEWTDGGFASTSASERVGLDFASDDEGKIPGSQPIALRIRVPKGTPAVAIDSVLDRGGPGDISSYLDEQEILLADGLTYRITRDYGVVRGVRRFDVEVVPATDTPPPPRKAARKAAATLPDGLPAGSKKAVARDLPDGWSMYSEPGERWSVFDADGKKTFTIRATQVEKDPFNGGRRTRKGETAKRYMVTVPGRPDIKIVPTRTRAEALALGLDVHDRPRADVTPRELGDGSAGFGTTAPDVEPPAEAAARTRQATMDRARSVSGLLRDVDEFLAHGASDKALAARIRSRSEVAGTPPELRDALLANVNDRDALRQILDSAASDAGLRPIAQAGDRTTFDPARHEALGDKIPTGTPVRVTRQGYVTTVDGDEVVLDKAVVMRDDLPDTSRSTIPDAGDEAAWDEVARAAGHDTTLGHDELHHWWVTGPGRARWQTWTELRDQLLEHVSPEKAATFASSWFHERYGYWSGSDLNRVKHGKPPRGDKVGPG